MSERPGNQGKDTEDKASSSAEKTGTESKSSKKSSSKKQSKKSTISKKGSSLAVASTGNVANSNSVSATAGHVIDANEEYLQGCEAAFADKWDVAEARWKVAADLKHPMASYDLAQCLLKGKELEYDPVRAKKLLERSVRHGGDSDAILLLAQLYAFGALDNNGAVIVPPEESSAKDLMKKLQRPESEVALLGGPIRPYKSGGLAEIGAFGGDSSADISIPPVVGTPTLMPVVGRSQIKIFEQLPPAVAPYNPQFHGPSDPPPLPMPGPLYPREPVSNPVTLSSPAPAVVIKQPTLPAPQLVPFSNKHSLSQWTVILEDDDPLTFDVSDWLTSWGLSSDVVEAFLREELMRPSQIVRLTIDDMRELGLNMGARKRLTRAIERDFSDVKLVEDSFHGVLDRDDAEVILNKLPVGSYLLRVSSQAGELAASVVVPRVIHVRIARDENGVFLPDRGEIDELRAPTLRELLTQKKEFFVHAVPRTSD